MNFKINAKAAYINNKTLTVQNFASIKNQIEIHIQNKRNNKKVSSM